MPREGVIAAALVAVAAATAALWPAGETPADMPGAAAPAADTVRERAAQRAAMARVCADGCDAPALSLAVPAAAPLAAEADDADLVVAAAPLPPLPVDLEAWALEPSAVPVDRVAPVVERGHNLPVVPDDNDATPADETHPDEAQTEAVVGE